MDRLNFKKFKLFFLDIISFGSPQAISINLILILLVLSVLPISSVKQLPVVSVYSTIIIPYVFNNSCPTSGIFENCGFYSIGQTRAISSLLHGNFKGAYEYNKLVFVLFLAVLIILIVNLYKSCRFYRKTGKILRSS